MYKSDTFVDADRHRLLLDWFSGVSRGERLYHKIEYWPRGGGLTKTIARGIQILRERQPKRTLWIVPTDAEAMHLTRRFQYTHNPNVVIIGIESFRRYQASIKDKAYDVIVIEGLEIRDDAANYAGYNHRRVDTLASALQYIIEENDNAHILIADTRVNECGVIYRLFRTLQHQFPHRLFTWNWWPAVYALKYQSELSRVHPLDNRADITRGTAAWPLQSIQECQRIINDIGIGEFLQQYQCDNDKARDRAIYEEVRPHNIPPAHPGRSSTVNADLACRGSEPPFSR
jgi:hypothetical protein